jgi:hypothetical protein
MVGAMATWSDYYLFVRLGSSEGELLGADEGNSEIRLGSKKELKAASLMGKN